LLHPDVQSYWFEIFSNIGGLCGVVGGFSLIGFTEIFYFMLKQLFLLAMRKLKVKFKSRSLQIYP
jgi:amiloride-sensitive sodium channel